MKPIFLVGYMGSGKSSVGKELAEMMHLLVMQMNHYKEDLQDLKLDSMLMFVQLKNSIN